MKELIDAARAGDFIVAKEIYDEQVITKKADPVTLLNECDARGKTVAHYAAEYDEVVVIEWLHRMGANLFLKDNNNKSPIDITVLLNAKRQRHKKDNDGESACSEILPFIKSNVLNPVQQMFYLEQAESSKSVTSVKDLDPLSVEGLSEEFDNYNNLQAAHVFALSNMMNELKYLHTRGVDLLHAVDDDGNTVLHFASSPEMVDFLVKVCQLNVNQQNTSDENTPAHAVVLRVANDEVTEETGVGVLEALINNGADLSIKCDSYDMGVTELIIDLLGSKSKLIVSCMKSSTALGGKSLASYLEEHDAGDESDSSEVSVASHNDKVVDEDGNESSDSSVDCSEDDASSDSDTADFFIKHRK